MSSNRLPIMSQAHDKAMRLRDQSPLSSVTIELAANLGSIFCNACDYNVNSEFLSKCHAKVDDILHNDDEVVILDRENR